MHLAGKTLRISPHEPPLKPEEQKVTTRVEQHKVKDIDETSVVLDIPKSKTEKKKKILRLFQKSTSRQAKRKK